MGFPPELWFEDVRGPGPAGFEGTKKPPSLSERVERLFETVRSTRTGEPYTDAEVARAALGNLTEGEVRRIRSGRLSDPTVSQVSALAAFFRVDPAYFLDASGEAPLLDEESLRALGDEKSRTLLHKSLGLTTAEKDLLLDMIEHLARVREQGGG
jgi:transcriptional regulator with XRE-family HTH domain